jgi:hypothetical protein
MKPSRSFDHTLEPMGVLGFVEGDEQHYRCGCGPYASYRYITGRKGRVGRRVILYCREHAVAFGHRHGLPMPTGGAQ